MKVVVDTNIVFSAILNSSGNIGKVLVNYGRQFEFYSCDFLKTEIALHQKKLLKLTRLNEAELNELITLCIKNIRFINESIVPAKDWRFAIDLLQDIDVNDAAFVALARNLKANLWTGDKKLIQGLTKQGYKKFVSTQQLLDNLNGK
jgi:predicted nucleic acid-binding protein